VFLCCWVVAVSDSGVTDQNLRGKEKKRKNLLSGCCKKNNNKKKNWTPGK